jgi:tetratricopeptide (TPR) repeat protein
MPQPFVRLDSAIPDGREFPVQAVIKLNQVTRKLFLLCGLLAAGALFAAENYAPEALREANRGVSLSQNSKYREAIEAYRKAIAIDHRLPGIYLDLGLAYFKLGDFRNARDAFAEQERTRPDARVTTLLAMSDFGLGQYRAAADRLRPLYDTQPGNPELGYLLAKCYVWSGQQAQAMDLFHALLDRDPNSVPVHMLLGEALDADSRTDDAIAEFEAAAKTSSTQPEVHFGLGYLYWKRRRYDEAAGEFREELAHNPESAQSFAYLGDVLMKEGHTTEATEMLKKAIALRDDLHVAHMDLGILYSAEKQYGLAMTQFRAAARYDPTAFDAHYRLARLYGDLGRTKDADAEFAIVKKLHEKKNEDPLMKISGP